FRWTTTGGFQNLGSLGAGFDATGRAISAYGNVVVGASESPNGMRAIRWTSATGMVNLRALPGADDSIALDGSANGAAVVGVNTGEGGAEVASLWTQALGMVDLNTYLPSRGIDLTGWTLQSATSISAGGDVLAGYGRHEFAPGQFRTEGWVAT